MATDSKSKPIKTRTGETLITQQEIKNGFTKLVIAEGLPFTFGEGHHTVKFFNSLNPNFRKFTADEVLQDAFDGFEKSKNELRSTFASLGNKIALACDVWCNEFGRHFLCVTAHWIATDWVMQRRIIDFIWLDLDDYDKDIINRTKECIFYWGISDKVFSFTSDDVMNNAVVVDGLKDVVRPVLDGKLFHSNCVVRGLNACLVNGWECVNNQVDMIWRGVCIVRNNFELFCERYGHEPKPTIFYEERKWDTIREMLRTFIPYKDAVSEFVASFAWNVEPEEVEEMDSDDDTEPYVPVVISERDWEVASLFCIILDVFYEAVDEISGNYKPSSCVVLRQLVNIAKMFSELKESVLFNERFSAMKETYLKNFGKIPEIYCVAAVMDPRVKVSGCHCLLEMFYKYTDNVTVNVGEEMKGISNLLQEMYILYANKSTKGQCSILDPTTNDHAWSLISQNRNETVVSAVEELAVYLQTPPLSKHESGNLDILAWWKKNEKNYPVLASMARDLLTIPLSTLAPDCAFVLNKEKHILDERMFELSESDIDFTEDAMESFKKQMLLRTCFKDWLLAEMRVQGKREFEYDECLGPYPEEEEVNKSDDQEFSSSKEGVR